MLIEQNQGFRGW